METLFLSTGLACIIAAIIGGGLKAFQIELPALHSVRRQWLLGTFGVILIIVSVGKEAVSRLTQKPANDIPKSEQAATGQAAVIAPPKQTPPETKTIHPPQQSPVTRGRSESPAKIHSRAPGEGTAVSQPAQQQMVPSDNAVVARGPEFVHTARDTIGWKDPRTGLTWQRQNDEAPMPSGSASHYCWETSAKEPRWRLPTRDELTELFSMSNGGEHVKVSSGLIWSRDDRSFVGLVEFLTNVREGGEPRASRPLEEGLTLCVRPPM
jgi:hypothetical protein